VPIIFDFSNEWIAFITFLGIILSFIGLSEIARMVLKITPEVSRKFVHVMVGVLVSLAPFFLTTTLPVISLGILFTILNAFALKRDAFKGMHATERVSFGTVYFPIAFTLLVIMFWERNIVIFVVSMLILAFSDTAATIMGEKLGSKHKFILWHDKKSWAGSLTFFLMTLVIVITAFPIYSRLSGHFELPLHHLISMAIFVGLTSTVGEAVSKRGSDNLTLTLTAALGLDLYLINMIQGTLMGLAGWALFSAIMGWGAYKLKSLSISGGFGAFLLGLFMFGMGGWTTMLPLIGFFFLSSLLSKIADRSARKDLVSKKGSQRDIVQVYANGGIPLIFAIAWYLSHFSIPWLYWGFLASLAAATADTWETEIGSYSKNMPFDILGFKPVPRGYSGGISWIGTFGGYLGAATIGLIAIFATPMEISPLLFFLIITAGFAGSLIDSILGSSIQAKFECTVCKKPTERLAHCQIETKHVSGILWFDNDWVNLAGTLSGGLIFYLCYLIFL
jgi:uncharacterized protein (TIGR00297 family)